MALFYFGDPCYAMTASEWNDANDLFFDDQFASFYEFEDGRQFVMKRWDFGDMSGVDKDGFAYACDSGCYGIVKVTDIDKECMASIKPIAELKGCRFVDLDADSVEEVVERGLGPFDLPEYSEEDFVMVEDII
jgi:hypothetical protein